jgi:hypothetical protein
MTEVIQTEEQLIMKMYMGLTAHLAIIVVLCLIIGNSLEMLTAEALPQRSELLTSHQEKTEKAREEPTRSEHFTTDRQVVNDHTWAIVKVGKKVIFGIPSDAGGYSRDERAQIVAEQRLGRLYGKVALDDRANYRVRKEKGQVAICVANPKNVANLGNPALLLTIDRDFEKVLKRDRWDIAYYWRDMLIGRPGVKTALASPAKNGGARGKVVRGQKHRNWRSRVRIERRVTRYTRAKSAHTDPAGRKLDDDNSWHMIPEGYGQGK